MLKWVSLKRSRYPGVSIKQVILIAFAFLLTQVGPVIPHVDTRDGSHRSRLLFVTSQVNEMRRLNSSESQIKPKRDAFDFHLQRGAVA